jgi:hypothetical protein
MPRGIPGSESRAIPIPGIAIDTALHIIQERAERRIICNECGRRRYGTRLTVTMNPFGEEFIAHGPWLCHDCAGVRAEWNAGEEEVGPIAVDFAP